MNLWIETSFLPVEIILCCLKECSFVAGVTGCIGLRTLADKVPAYVHTTHSSTIFFMILPM